MIIRKLLKALPVAVLLIPVAAQGCEPENGKANKATHAGDGVTQFSTNGLLKFGKSYTADAVGKKLKDCEWSLKTINKNTGKVKVVGSGTYKNAKIRVAKPDTVDVFLKSEDCGLWR